MGLLYHFSYSWCESISIRTSNPSRTQQSLLFPSFLSFPSISLCWNKEAKRSQCAKRSPSPMAFVDGLSERWDSKPPLNDWMNGFYFRGGNPWNRKIESIWVRVRLTVFFHSERMKQYDLFDKPLNGLYALTTAGGIRLGFALLLFVGSILCIVIATAISMFCAKTYSTTLDRTAITVNPFISDRVLFSVDIVVINKACGGIHCCF